MNNEQETKFTSLNLDERELDDQELEAVAGGIDVGLGDDAVITILGNNPRQEEEGDDPQFQVLAVQQT